MSECRIRFAGIEDIPAIMKYIDDYWKKGHILATNKKLFEWQYVSKDKLNFVIGVDEENQIQGILGYIPYASDNNKDIALALWKANRTEFFLGVRLLLFLKKEEHYRNIICTGINMATTSKIYMQLGMQVGTMNQWYRLRRCNKYVIGKICNNEIPRVDFSHICLKKVMHFSELENSNVFDYAENTTTPYKSASYFKKRYFEHPIYHYLVYSIVNESESMEGVLVLRIQECNESKVFRFVDYIGPQALIPKITCEIDKIMEENKVEYIDMYEAGVEEEVLIEAGWRKVKESGNIIPNYFAPYEQSNVEMYYCTSDDGAMLFRGDGDQDRPS